ncbi:MAG TPA: extracellular solute-binding protein [Chloroflexota bacterium]|nr:extracellular solute-binding protein [Chloroflexota bacterium]
MQTTRRIVLALTAGGAASVLAACGAGSQATPQAAQQPVTLRHAVNTGATGFQVAERKVLEAFNRKGSHVTVQQEPISPPYPGILAQISAGTPPDVCLAHPRDSRVLLDAGGLEPLDEYMRKDRKNTPDILPNVFGYFLQDGKQYFVPNNSAPHAVYFNRTIFKQRGVKMPDEYEKEGKWNMDAFLDVARRTTGTVNDRRVWGTDWFWNQWDIQLAFIWPFGGDAWDKPNLNTVLDSKEALEAIQYQADLTVKHQVSPTPDEKTANGGGAIFANGQIAMFITTNAIVADFAGAAWEKGMAPVPAGRAGRIVRNVPNGIHVLKGGRHKEHAFEYANFQGGLESEKIMLADQVTAPWHKSTLGSADYARALHPWQSAPYYAETVNKVRPTFYPSQNTEIQRLYGAAYTSVYTGQKTASIAVGEIKAQINDLLKKK